MTNLTDVDDVDQAAREAEREAAEAEQLARHLEDRIAGGDDTVTAEQLDEQQRLSRFAKLRAAGAGRKLQQARRDAARAAAAAAVDQVAGIETLDAELVDAWSAVAKAVRGLAELAQRRADGVIENADLLAAHDAKLRHLGAGSVADLGVATTKLGERGYRLREHGVDVAWVRPTDILATAVEAGARQLLARELMTLDATRKLAGTSLAAKVTGWDAAAREAGS